MSRKALTCAGVHIAEDDHDLSNPELARSLEPEVSLDGLAVASDQTWNFESELADRGTHAIHSGIVLARISKVLA